MDVNGTGNARYQQQYEGTGGFNTEELNVAKEKNDKSL